jgi:hypothetical protein
LHNRIDVYHDSLVEVFTKLKQSAPKARIIWRGTLILPKTTETLPYERTAANVSRHFGVEYFNTTYWYHYFMEVTRHSYSISNFSSDSLHIGVIAKWRDSSHKLTLSGFLTQSLIRQICPG